MAIRDQEYVIAPWGEGDCETDDVTVELPSRELVVQLEVPTHVLENVAQLGETHGITVERALAERLEINRARVSLLTAQSVDGVTAVRTHLTEAREYLAGVEELDTDGIEDEIERVWTEELDSV